jgi:tetratricopeptide (TPR) repeat protein
MRTILIVFSVAISACNILAGCDSPFFQQPVTESRQKPEQPRVRGLIPTSVAEAEVPAGAPMIGEEGTDKYGYPIRRVDKVGILALFRNGEYDRLTEYVESFQKEFEADFKKEYWIFDSIDSFDNADPRMEEGLNVWVKSHPDSFVPYAARANFFSATGWAYRGSDISRKTSKEQFKLMADYHVKAMEDFQKVLALNPRVMIAYTSLMGIYRANKGNDAKQKSLYEKAGTACPDCYLTPLWRIWDLEPRWGGSMEQMKQFADDEAKNIAANPRLAVLGGFPAYELCKIRYDEKQYDNAMLACNQALVNGESSWFYYRRGNIYRSTKKYTEALADYESALKLEPQLKSVLYPYAWTLSRQGVERWKEAGEALLTLLRLEPTHKKGPTLIERLTWKLNDQAMSNYDDGKKDEAKSSYELVAKLNPDDAVVRRRIESLLAGNDPRTEEEKVIWNLVSKSKQEPNNIKIVLELDSLLFKKRKLKEIVSHWDRFIANNPDNARAYQERSGTYSHLRDFNNTLKDATKACELGSQVGCHAQKKLERIAKERRAQKQ